MKIHQAYFGDKNGTHNLIVTSLENKVVIGHLKLNTDIPASITIQESYLSGFKIDAYYVLTKTMNDPGSERPGMGFSHCLIIPVELLGDINELEDLIRLFVNTPQKDSQVLPDLELNANPATISEATANVQDMLLKLTGNTGTVVYLGYQHFENDLRAIWRMMSAKLRANFAFTISGSPNEIANELYTLIHTPETYEPRWSKFPVIKNMDIAPETLEPIRLLTEPTSPEAIELEAFIQTNSIDLEYLHRYPAILKLFRLSKQAIAAPEAVLIKRVIIAINDLIPNPEHGTALKQNMLDLFVKSISPTETSGVLLLRNMVFNAFASGALRIAQLMADWSAQFIAPQNQSFLPEGTKVMQEAYLPENPEWWKAPIVSQFGQVCETIDQRSADFIWTLWTHLPDLIPLSPVAPSGEMLLYAKSKHVSDPEFYKKLTPYSASKHWYVMHAESVSYELKPLPAIQAQLDLDKSAQLEQHLDIIRANITDSAFFKASTTIDNLTIQQMAGKLLVAHPAYFTGIDVTDLNWQKIWYQAYLHSNDITVGGKAIKAEFDGIMDMVISKSNYVKPLLKAIANHTGDIYAHPSRKAVWNLLDSETRTILLNRTCAHIVNHFEPAQWHSFEAEIKQYFLKPEFIKAQIVASSTIGIAQKITILETINKISGELIVAITSASHNTINHLEAETLVNVINKYSLREALDYFYQNRRHYQLFTEVVNGCKHMLSGWDKLWLKSTASPVSLKDLYKEIDHQNLHKVFKILKDLGFDDHEINRLQKEYVAGAKGIDLDDLCNRLKSYVHSIS